MSINYSFPQSYLDYYPVYSYKGRKNEWLDNIRNKRHGKPKTKKSKKCRR